MTFYFDARLPASQAYLEPLREILRQAFATVGYPALEASEMAGAIEAVVARDLPAGHGRGELHVCIHRGAAEVQVEVTSPHLPIVPTDHRRNAPPPAFGAAAGRAAGPRDGLLRSRWHAPPLHAPPARPVARPLRR